MEMLLSNQSIPKLLIFWFLLTNGNLTAISRSNNSAKFLVAFSQSLKSEYEKLPYNLLENVIYGLVQGTLLSYLVYCGHNTTPHFPNTSNIALLARALFSDAIEITKQLSHQESIFGLYPKLLFQQAELEYVHFERYDAAIELLTQCMEKLTPLIPPKSLVSSIVSDQPLVPSFARVKQVKLEADSVSDMSASFLSQFDTSGISAEEMNGPFNDIALKENCRNALAILETINTKQ